MSQSSTRMVRNAKDDMTQVGLRTSERTRQRLMQESARTGLSINVIINQLIEQGLEGGSMKTLQDIANDMNKSWGRIRKAVG